jgi:hypothetical protein
MRNLERVVQHMNSLQDKCKMERVAAFVRANERRNRRLKQTVQQCRKQRARFAGDEV